MLWSVSGRTRMPGVLKKPTGKSFRSEVGSLIPRLLTSYLAWLSLRHRLKKHIACDMLAPSAVASATFSLRASAHPAGGFLSYRKVISYTTRNLSVIQICVHMVFPNRLIGGTDNLSVVGKLFQTVCAPTDNTGHGEDWCIKFHW